MADTRQTGGNSRQQNDPPPPAPARVPSSRFAEVYGMSEAQVDVVRRVMCPTATDDELHYFFAVAKRTGLDPLTNQVWLVRRPQKVTDAYGRDEYIEVAKPMTGIDGYRVIAQRSGEYEGQGPLQWCGDDGVWVDVWLKRDFPAAARATVHRRGFREPLVAVALWDEYVPSKRNGDPMPKWKQSPAQMLGKVAEALALRKGFPHDLSGLYVDEEMDRNAADAVSYVAPPTAKPANADTPAPAAPPTLESAEQKAKADAALAEFQRECEAAMDHAALKSAQRHLDPYFKTEKEPLSADVLKRGESVYMTNDRRIKAAAAAAPAPTPQPATQTAASPPTEQLSTADSFISDYLMCTDVAGWTELETKRQAVWVKLSRADKHAVKEASDIAKTRVGA